MALLSKKMMGFLYGMGAAVVIVGALFKLQHWTGADIMLIIGLLTEAAIFALSAFEPVEKDLDWSLVYPELAGGESNGKKSKAENPGDAQGLLSQKLDSMLKEAKIDGELMASLGNSIKNFEGAAKSISPTVDAMSGQKKYAEEMSTAAAQMEALNGLYKLQLDSASRNVTANQEIADNAAKLKEQMQSMTSNIASLNAVYGGMLTAMSNRG
ncbi:gliding motility-related protein [Flavobacteria bacterium BAL38]|nr:gliding motility-related protein [Flavobacteria bacterium BAL38]